MLTVHSNFESGSISVLEANKPTDIKLALKKDNASCTKQWFYFAVETEHVELQNIRITNAHEASFKQGWHDYKAFASYDQNNWFRVDSQYQNGELIIEHNAQSNVVYYAYFVPYLQSDADKLLTSLTGAKTSRSQNLTKTALGHSIDLIQLGSDDKTAQQIWFIARQHPGESMAEWIIDGAMTKLIELESTANNVFDTSTFNFIINMNPDGSVLGNHRTNSQGKDLNRQWSEPDPELCPEVYSARNAMQNIGVDWFIDIHGDESIPHNFMMVENNHPVGEQLKQTLAQLNSHFQTQYDYDSFNNGCGASTCGNSCGSQKATTYVAKQFAAVSILLEASFKELQSKVETTSWDHLSAKKLGESLVEVLVQQLNSKDVF